MGNTKKTTSSATPSGRFLQLIGKSLAGIRLTCRP